MHVLLSVLLATTLITDSENPKKKLETDLIDEEAVLENSDPIASQEIVMDDSVEDFYSDLEEEEE